MNPIQSKSKLNIVFLGNINNNFFSLSRYLRDSGVNCKLILFGNEKKHFHPSNDTYRDDFAEWVEQVEWGSKKTFNRINAAELSRWLSAFDFRVGCGMAPAFCYKAGVRLDVFVPHGNDLRGHIEYDWRKVLRKLISNRVVAKNIIEATRAQRAGISSCKVVHMAHKTDGNNIHEKNIHRLNRKHIRWKEPVPMVYVPEYTPENIAEVMKNSELGAFISRVREQSQFIVVCHSRHNWGSRSSMSNKGKGILLEGWKIFLQETGQDKAKLIFVEYGTGVDITKRRVHELGLSHSIIWLPLMARKDIMQVVMSSDVVANEFVHSFTGGGVLFEGMAARKPVLTRIDCKDKKYFSFDDSDHFFDSNLPVCPASTSKDIAIQLKVLSENPQRAKIIGEAAYQWYVKWKVKAGLDRYLDLFGVR